MSLTSYLGVPRCHISAAVGTGAREHTTTAGADLRCDAAVARLDRLGDARQRSCQKVARCCRHSQSFDEVRVSKRLSMCVRRPEDRKVEDEVEFPVVHACLDRVKWAIAACYARPSMLVHLVRSLFRGAT